MKDIVIRRLKKEDGADIGLIHAAITQRDLDLNFGKIVDQQAENINDASFVAEYRGKVVGYMIGSVLEGLFGIKRSAWIMMMGVNPKYMGRGIGEQLATKLFSLLKEKGLDDVYTSVPWDSTDLLSFCKTLGFDRSRYINLIKKL